MELGAIYATKGVAECASRNPAFMVELSIILARYCFGDWGELCKEDWVQRGNVVCNSQVRGASGG